MIDQLELRVLQLILSEPAPGLDELAQAIAAGLERTRAWQVGDDPAKRGYADAILHAAGLATSETRTVRIISPWRMCGYDHRQQPRIGEPSPQDVQAAVSFAINRKLHAQANTVTATSRRTDHQQIAQQSAKAAAARRRRKAKRKARRAGR